MHMITSLNDSNLYSASDLVQAQAYTAAPPPAPQVFQGLPYLLRQPMLRFPPLDSGRPWAFFPASLGPHWPWASFLAPLFPISFFPSPITAWPLTFLKGLLEQAAFPPHSLPTQWRPRGAIPEADAVLGVGRRIWDCRDPVGRDSWGTAAASLRLGLKTVGLLNAQILFM